MRVLVRAALSATVVAMAAAMAPVVPAQASDAGWEYVNYPSLMITEDFWVHQHIDGRKGNWHRIDIRVQQDDDPPVGQVLDMRCARGVKPDAQGFADCTIVGAFDWWDNNDLNVTYSKRLRYVHVFGDLLLDDEASDTDIPSTMDLHLRARGDFTKSVTYGAPTSTDPLEYKTVDIRRSRVTARGFMDSVEVSPDTIALKDTEPIRVYWIMSRIPPV